MDIYSGEILLFVFTLSMAISIASAQEDSIKKEAIINDIMKQVNIITKEALSKVGNNNKYAAIKEIEHKIRNIAQSFGPDGESLVKILMQGVRTNIFHGNMSTPETKRHLRYDLSSNESKDNPAHTTKYQMENNKISNLPSLTVITSNHTKTQLINDFAVKVQALTRKYFNKTQTVEERSKLMDVIQSKILESAKKKDLLNKMTLNKRNYYVDLIKKGVSLAAFRAQDEKNNNLSSRKVNSLDDYSDIDEHIMRLEKHIQFDQAYCEHVIKDLCTDIKSLDVLKCTLDGSDVLITKLCNGFSDCPDSTDELSCKDKVITQVHNARNIIRMLEAPTISSCFTALNSPSLLLTNEQTMLRRLLDRQIKFVRKYARFTNSSSSVYNTDESIDEKTFLNTINEVTAVIQTLSSALDGFVCLKEELSEMNQRAQIAPDVLVDELDAEINQVPTWSPKYCKCNKEHCATEDCDNNCKRVCWEKYSLAHWSCNAVNGQMTVPIDVICDGKLDCLDETDEADCSIGQNHHKIEAVSTYENILNQVEERTHKYSLDLNTRNALLALHTSVKKLQHIVTKSSPDMTQVKIIRDQCFANLQAVYEEIRRHASFVEEIDTANLFLTSMNKLLVRALKYKHFGNKLSPDGCLCRKNKCALSYCTRTCIRACSAETVLTKYRCEGKDNVSIAVEYICNGKKNCPNGDDELCQKNEVCRAHHLVVLRHKINKIDMRQHGVLGELIKGWKEKATSRLIIAEKKGRPSPRYMKDIIHDLIQDLLMMYGTIDEYRRSIALNHNVILDKFIDISTTVMDSLRSCGK